jgi:hypothetical protein
MLNQRWRQLGETQLRSEWCLFRYEGDPLRDLVTYLDLCGGATPFFVRVPAPAGCGEDAAPIEGLFELRVLRMPRGASSISFSWEHRAGFSLPSIRGSIASRRFGAFVGVSVSGSYRTVEDAASGLFEETIGRGLAQATLREALSALQYLLECQLIEASQ